MTADLWDIEEPQTEKKNRCYHILPISNRSPQCSVGSSDKLATLSTGIDRLQEQLPGRRKTNLTPGAAVMPFEETGNQRNTFMG